MPKRKNAVAKLVLLAVLGGLAWLVYARFAETQDPAGKRAARDRAIPVEVSAIERRPIEWRRTFTGTLEAHAEFVVAPKQKRRKNKKKRR